MRFDRAPLAAQASFKKLYGTSFKAGGIRYRIIWCYEIEAHDRKCYGLCDTKDKKVYIDIRQDDIQETLIHEMLHAEFQECGMRQMDSLFPDLEELCCEAASRVVRNFTIKKR